MSGVWYPEVSGVRNSSVSQTQSRAYNVTAVLIEHVCVNPFFTLVRGTPPFNFSEQIPFLSFLYLTGCI